MSERIVHAAIRYDMANYYAHIPGARHGDLIRMLASVGLGDAAKLGEQGFVTDSCNRFVDRVEALAIARSANQLIAPTDRDELFSEDVW